MAFSIDNNSGRTVDVKITGQPLTQIGVEIKKIATLDATELDYMRDIAKTFSADLPKQTLQPNTGTQLSRS